MKKYKNLSLNGKFLLLTLGCLVFFFTIIITNFLQKKEMEDVKNKIANNAFVAYKHQTADMMHDAMRSDIYAAIYSKTSSDFINAKNDFESHSQLFKINVKEAQEAAAEIVLQEKLNEVNKPLLAYLQYCQSQIEQKEKKGKSFNIEFEKQIPEFIQHFKTLEVSMAKVSAEIIDETKALEQQGSSDYFTSIWIDISLCLLFLAFVTYIIVQKHKYTIKPVQEMTAVLEKIENGETVLYQDIEQDDEVGRISSAITGIVASLNNIKLFVKQVGLGNEINSSSVFIFNNKGEIHDALLRMKITTEERTDEALQALLNAKEKNDEAVAINKELQASQEELKINLEYVNEANQKLAEKEKTIIEQLVYQNALLEGTEYSIISTYPDGTIKTFNKGAEKMLGYTAEEMIDKTSPAPLHDLDEIVARAAVLSEELKQDIQPGFDVFVAKSRLGEADTNEWTYIKKDGTRFPVLLSITTLWNDKKEIIGYLGIAADLSQKKKQEEQLLQTNKEMSDLRYALDQIAIVAITDVKGNIIFANEKFTEISKYSKDELLGQNHRILNSGHHSPDFFVDMWKTIANGKIWRAEVCNKNKLGEIYWVDTIIVPILGEDKKPFQYIAIRNDITERKKAEKVLVKNLHLQKEKEVAENSARVKGEFLANMSHEIRTPMNGVIGMIDLLEKNTAPSPLQMEYLETIKSSSKTLLAIINDILDLSKLEAGKMTLNNTPIYPHAIVHQIKDLFKAVASEKKIEVLSEYSEDFPNLISSDGTRLKQVLANFVSNAIKFTNEGHVKIKADVVEKNNDKYTLKFSISDTGIGMKQEEIKTLFNAFNQLDSSSAKKHEGTGLGLAISKQIIELFGGEVGVESDYKKGSTFWFTIKTEISQQQQQQQQQQDEELTADLNGLRVLLVDDKQVNLIVAKTMLMSLGCTVKTAKDGQQAVDTYIPGEFDVVLMDIQMPIMDGVEATKLIKEKDENMTNIIALTANAMEGDKEKYLTLGLDDYLAKPIELEVLRTKLVEIKNKRA